MSNVEPHFTLSSFFFTLTSVRIRRGIFKCCYLLSVKVRAIFRVCGSDTRPEPSFLAGCVGDAPGVCAALDRTCVGTHRPVPIATSSDSRMSHCVLISTHDHFERRIRHANCIFGSFIALWFLPVPGFKNLHILRSHTGTQMSRTQLFRSIIGRTCKIAHSLLFVSVCDFGQSSLPSCSTLKRICPRNWATLS